MGKIFCSIIITLFFASALTYAEKKAGTPSFKGRVILVKENCIEVKFGKNQNIFYFAEDSKLRKVTGEELKKKDIIICQTVELSYHVSDGKRIISSLSVLKESDCVR